MLENANSNYAAMYTYFKLPKMTDNPFNMGCVSYMHLFADEQRRATVKAYANLFATNQNKVHARTQHAPFFH